MTRPSEKNVKKIGSQALKEKLRILGQGFTYYMFNQRIATGTNTALL
jgi:hypothetical protein